MPVREPLRTVIFDGDCAFCLRSIALGRRLDWWGCLEWWARLEPGVRERFPQLSQEETQRRMVSIRPDGRTYGGFFAVRDIMLHLPLTLLPALLLYLPGMARIGVPCYRWIASNRYRFGGEREEACGISCAPREHGEDGG